MFSTFYQRVIVERRMLYCRQEAQPRMNLATLLIILGIAAVAALIVRVLAGFTIAGCLIAYVLACIGAAGGWALQRQLWGLDPVFYVPLLGESQPVSVGGAVVGSLVLAYVGGLFARPRRAPSRNRTYR
jgi:hypothetical protein